MASGVMDISSSSQNHKSGENSDFLIMQYEAKSPDGVFGLPKIQNLKEQWTCIPHFVCLPYFPIFPYRAHGWLMANGQKVAHGGPVGNAPWFLDPMRHRRHPVLSGRWKR